MKKINGWENFAELCLASESKQQLADLFELFFTPEEKATIDLRIKLIGELVRGEKPQRQIAQELNISIAKITRGSNALKRIDEELMRFLQKHYS